ncbi:MAG: nucleoside kinase [Clostridia bacterium]|nr:nucleoside kinase [Clostridia bacterium]
MKDNYTLSEVNSAVRKDAKAFIGLCINNYEKQVERAVDNILKDSTVDIVMLAGPSSSGKTTTAKKLCEGIRNRGRNAYIISLDDFYFNRDDIPINKDGLPDYENVTALDIPLIEKTFNSLINEREAVVPIFNFQTGKREEKGNLIHIDDDDVIIVEGIHALNPIITGEIDQNHIYKIYISVSSRFTDDNGEILLTKRNIRFIRRMIRDYHFRASQVENTCFLWQGVLKGEDEFVFPYKEQADEFINSIHPFEECIFKSEAKELLGHIEKSSVYYDEVKRIYNALELFDEVSRDLLPSDSLLREFIG